MFPTISIIKDPKQGISTATLFEKTEQISHAGLSENEKEFLSKKLKKGTECSFLKYPELSFFGKIKAAEAYLEQEAARKAGAKLYQELKDAHITAVNLVNRHNSPLLSAFLEGLLLASYSFDKYLKEKETFQLKEVFVVGEEVSDKDAEELLNLTSAVFAARDLVNEPNSFLNAVQLSNELESLGEKAGFAIEVFNKQKIETLKMGGLLAVNKGSIDPPTFNILEWKPENAVNKKPIVLVGKGIVFDTGGLSLKPTANSMDYMKTDMAGAAVIATAIYVMALNKLPLHVVGLIAATDNRPDGNAYVPGDIITMFDGTTVEVLNTDAEGRLTLGDALSYAKKYDPQLVIDYATLTGAADIVAGPHAAVVMGNSSENIEKLKEAGFQTYERLIEVPLWEEYAKPLKSKIADLNNLGSREGQSTIAGKFLEHFTSYNWIHIDSAGTPFLKEADAYRPAGGTGFGTRLLYQFLKSMI
ncbi:leucyl aminopeptidase [Maribellus sp. CM-23]|uniref:leucyl aminopeptidase family protein n=1 Tax=Maribellus sp. CM-23 TaxID=2781026 RepID=UPI001F19D2CF|nr:leucyl aminopeptidase [Maribellus sp. CM-23]MCE4563103.1 leucyl aminopeptidase [Maribellus sp. CM-23]